MNTSKTGCDLHSCAFCTQCIKEWLPAIGAHRQTLQYEKGETIFREGEPVQGIFFLNAGRAKVHSRWEENKELIVRFAGPGDIVGHRGMNKHLIYPVTATAMEPVSACFVTLEFFEASLKVNPSFMYRLLLFYAEELQESERRMRNLAHMPVKGRVAQALLSLKEKFGINEQGVLGIGISRQDFASYVGATYETVFRTMSELAEENLVTVKGRQIMLKDPAALLKRSVENNPSPGLPIS